MLLMITIQKCFQRQNRYTMEDITPVIRQLKMSCVNFLNYVIKQIGLEAIQLFKDNDILIENKVLDKTIGSA